ncbi:MAG: hypothetical protein GX539_10955 [Candidatus Cloacimonetes bacterium]|nr:hypothetical protein [Candidatus Cloacimonadota bacterium]
MSKPQIIGYEVDPAQVWTAPPMPEIQMDKEGISIPAIGIDDHGDSFEARRYLGADEIDGFMRFHGMKRVYQARQFHAKRAYGGYRLHCRTCKETTLTSGYLPHDAALRHRCKS